MIVILLRETRFAVNEWNRSKRDEAYLVFLQLLLQGLQDKDTQSDVNSYNIGNRQLVRYLQQLISCMVQQTGIERLRSKVLKENKPIFRNTWSQRLAISKS